MPCEAALGQFPGRPIVKAVVRLLAHSDQVPTAPLPAGEIVNRVNVVNCGRSFVTPITAGLSASVAVAPQDRVPQAQPAFAFVIHRQIKKRHDLTRRSWRSCHPAITSGAEQKRQMIFRFHGQNHLALALALRLWLWLIFTIVSRLHILQYSGKSVSLVLGRTRCCVGRPHSGQTNLPSADTNSISCAFLFCKTFVPPFR